MILDVNVVVIVTLTVSCVTVETGAVITVLEADGPLEDDRATVYAASDMRVIVVVLRKLKCRQEIFLSGFPLSGPQKAAIVLNGGPKEDSF